MTLSAAFDEPVIRPNQERDDLMAAVGRSATLAKMHPPQVVPPVDVGDSWQTLFNGSLNNFLVEAKLFKADKDSLATKDLSAILAAYDKHDTAGFNDKVAAYHGWLAEHGPSDYAAQKVDFEAYFNRFAPLFRRHLALRRRVCPHRALLRSCGRVRSIRPPVWSSGWPFWCIPSRSCHASTSRIGRP